MSTHQTMGAAHRRWQLMGIDGSRHDLPDITANARTSGPRAPAPTRRSPRSDSWSSANWAPTPFAAWREKFAAIDPARLVFVAEPVASTAMDRTYGRALSGMRVAGPVPHGHRRITTLTAAVQLDGVPTSACPVFYRATDSACFEAYIGRCLVPALRPTLDRGVPPVE